MACGASCSWQQWQAGGGRWAHGCRGASQQLNMVQAWCPVAGWGPRLLALARLRVDLREQLGDLALLHERVDVQHGLVPGREDRLVLQQVQDLRRTQGLG
jgi:hypothetical protein